MIALRSRSKQIKKNYKFDLTSPIYGLENLYFTYYAMFAISIIYILIIKMCYNSNNFSFIMFSMCGNIYI